MIALFGHKKQMTDEEIGELFRSTYPRLYRLAYSLLNDQEESKDVVSGVFMEILDKHILARDINTYLISMVRNRALDILRHRQVKDDVQTILLQEYEQVATYEISDDEHIKEIHNFIEKELTPKTRKVLQLCYDDKKSYKEVSSELGISIQAVNKHISQALRKLRKRFNPSMAIIFAASCIAVAAIIEHQTIAAFLSEKSKTDVSENSITKGQYIKQTISTDTTIIKPHVVAFDNAELCEIMDSINNIYKVKVVFNNEEVKHLHLHFKFCTDDKLNDVIQSLDMFEKINIREKEGILEIE